MAAPKISLANLEKAADHLRSEVLRLLDALEETHPQKKKVKARLEKQLSHTQTALIKIEEQIERTIMANESAAADLAKIQEQAAIAAMEADRRQRENEAKARAAQKAAAPAADPFGAPPSLGEAVDPFGAPPILGSGGGAKSSGADAFDPFGPVQELKLADRKKKRAAAFATLKKPKAKKGKSKAPAWDPFDPFGPPSALGGTAAPSAASGPDPFADPPANDPFGAPAELGSGSTDPFGRPTELVASNADQEAWTETWDPVAFRPDAQIFEEVAHLETGTPLTLPYGHSKGMDRRQETLHWEFRKRFRFGFFLVPYSSCEVCHGQGFVAPPGLTSGLQFHLHPMPEPENRDRLEEAAWEGVDLEKFDEEDAKRREAASKKHVLHEEVKSLNADVDNLLADVMGALGGGTELPKFDAAEFMKQLEAEAEAEAAASTGGGDSSSGAAAAAPAAGPSTSLFDDDDDEDMDMGAGRAQNLWSS